MSLLIVYVVRSGSRSRGRSLNKLVVSVMRTRPVVVGNSG